MSILIEGGITIGTGVTISSEAVAPGGQMAFDPTYNFFGSLGFSNNNLTVIDNEPGQFSTLSTFQMTPGNKYMFSYTMDYYTDPISWIGVGNANIDTANGLGYDSNSIGFNNVGDYRFGGTVYENNVCNFTNAGDVIDLAVDTGTNLMWIRVNGGNWNNNPSGNPATASNGRATGGINSGYPALAVGGTNFYSQFSINETATYAVPAGFTFIGGAPTFVLRSSGISAGYGAFNTYNSQPFPVALGTNGVDGFTLPPYTGQPADASHAAWVPYIATLNNNADIADFFQQLVTNGRLTAFYETVTWDVTWGPGSTYAKGAVSLSGTTGANGQLYMAPLDTSMPGWDVSPPSNDNTVVLPGTYYFPATFTLRSPTVNKGGWC